MTLNDLTVDGTQGNTYADGFLGVAYFNAGGTVQNVTIENVENNPFNGVQNGVALYADNADGSSRTLNVTNNTINNYQKNGMTLKGNGLSVSVTGNVVTISGNTITAQNGGSGIDVIGDLYSDAYPGFGPLGPDQNISISNDLPSPGLPVYRSLETPSMEMTSASTTALQAR